MAESKIPGVFAFDLMAKAEDFSDGALSVTILKR